MLLQEKIKEWFTSLSEREKGMVLVAVIVTLMVGIENVYTPINERMTKQAKELDRLNKELQALPYALERYTKLQASKDLVEREFKGVEMKEGALAYLEGLVKTKAGIAEGFTIRDRTVRKFSEKYEQVPFAVNFRITDFPRLITFLEALTGGEQPLIVSQIELTRSRKADNLDVKIEVSSIRPATT